MSGSRGSHCIWSQRSFVCSFRTQEGVSFLTHGFMLVTLTAKERGRNLRTCDFQGRDNKYEAGAFNKARNFRISQQWPSLCGNYRVQTSPRKVFQSFQDTSLETNRTQAKRMILKIKAAHTSLSAKYTCTISCFKLNTPLRMYQILINTTEIYYRIQVFALRGPKAVGWQLVADVSGPSTGPVGTLKCRLL